VVYEIDSTDHIIHVNPAWSAVAEAVAAPGLRAPLILGRLLWDFIGDATTRQLYSTILERARTRARPLAFSFRCDTPTQRRLMHMRIARRAGAAVSFEVRTIATQERPPVALLEAGAPRSGSIVRMCSWCKRMPLPTGQWVEVEEAMKVLDILDAIPLPAISHGMCPACFEAITGTLGRDQTGDDGEVTLGSLP